jgi:uncharacterized protein (TIGR02679 family)
MSDSSDQRTNLQKAVVFFEQPVWTRLCEALYVKYMAQGRIGGQVVLHSCTLEEQRALARFLQKKLPQQSAITIRLSDFQQALDASGFACELPALLHALFPERPHTTRPQQREKKAISQQRFYERLSQLLAELPDDSPGQRWLLAGAHGRDELFRRYKNESNQAQEQLLRQVQTIAHALNQLPIPPDFERLAIFAQRATGDPHYFDGNVPTGRIFFRALMDLARREPSIQPSEQQLENAQLANSEAVTEVSEVSEQNYQRLLLYYEAGLLLDTISSTVAVFHLSYAEDLAGHPDELITATGERILTLSLRQLLAWKKLRAASKRIYLFENPQVFEVIVDELQRITANMPDNQKPQLPTLICTAGWPSMAVIRLLNQLIEAAPDSSLHYSGDFDIQGLRIASLFLARYAEQCHLWQFDPASYLTALHSQAAELSTSDRAGLQALPEIFAPLTAVMREHNKKAYQEGITQSLLQDIENNNPLLGCSSR